MKRLVFVMAVISLSAFGYLTSIHPSTACECEDGTGCQKNSQGQTCSAQ